MSRKQLENHLNEQNLKLIGVVDLGSEPQFPRFQAWLDQGQHASMEFLEQNLHLRADPRGLLPGAMQAVVFALPYYQGDLLQAAHRGVYAVAQYARLRDYHRLMKTKGERVLAQLKVQCPSLQGRVTIDSAPLLERALAARSQRGFIGKNTCFIHPEWGSFLLLGEILLSQILVVSDTPAAVDPDQRGLEGGCGTCRRCQVNCPTGALDEAYRLDARRCLAYWTIEHRGPIPFEFWPWLKTYVFGCDLCQLACPYNRASPITTEETRPDFKTLDLFEIATMDQQRYVALFAGTPLTRAKRSGLRRNALIALTVSADPRLDQALASIEADAPSVLCETREQIKEWRKRMEPSC